jgi:hypothetical protein
MTSTTTPTAPAAARATKDQFDGLRTLFSSRATVPEAEVLRIKVNIDLADGRITRDLAEEYLAALRAIPAASPNTYPGECINCGRSVAAEAGLRRRSPKGRWVVLHRHNECPVIEIPFPEGCYALEGHDGATEFYSVHDGAVFVRASDDEHELTDMDRARGVVAAIAFDHQAAAVLFGHKIGQCGYCRRSLTDERSISAGVGPVCARKHGIPW